MEDAMTVTPGWASWREQGLGGGWPWRGLVRGRARSCWALALAVCGLAGSGWSMTGPSWAPTETGETIATSEPSARPTARLDLGVGGMERGFRVSVDGGEPNGRALLVVRPLGEWGPASSRGVRTQLVELDEHGHGEVTHLRWRGRRDCEVFFLAANKGAGGGGATNPVTVPGSAATGSTVIQRGDVLINEFLKDPKSVSDPSGEWIELWNASSRTVNVEGWWLFDDGGDQHMLYNGAQGLYLQPGQYFVMARKADPASNGGVNVDYVYNGFSLANGDDEIRLVSRGGVLVDEVMYDDGVLWPDDSGKAISLDPQSRAANLNDDPAHWCHAQSPIAAGNPDLGTPGAKNDGCP